MTRGGRTGFQLPRQHPLRAGDLVASAQHGDAGAQGHTGMHTMHPHFSQPCNLCWTPREMETDKNDLGPQVHSAAKVTAAGDRTGLWLSGPVVRCRVWGGHRTSPQVGRGSLCLLAAELSDCAGFRGVRKVVFTPLCYNVSVSLGFILRKHLAGWGAIAHHSSAHEFVTTELFSEVFGDAGVARSLAGGRWQPSTCQASGGDSGPKASGRRSESATILHTFSTG